MMDQPRLAKPTRCYERNIPIVFKRCKQLVRFLFPIAKIVRPGISARQKWVFQFHGMDYITLSPLQQHRYGIFVMPSCVKEENHSNNWKVHQLVCYKRYVLSSLISATIFSARAASGMTRSGRRENGIISTVYGPA